MLSLQYNLDLLPNSKWSTINATATAKASFLYAQEIGDFYAGPPDPGTILQSGFPLTGRPQVWREG